MHSLRALLPGAIVACLAAAAQSAENTLELFASWAVGEFNNHEQVWQQQIDKVEQPTPHIHTRFTRLDRPDIAPLLLHIQQSDGVELDRIFRERLYRFSERDDGSLYMQIYRPRQRDAIDLEDWDSWELVAGCEEIWSLRGDYFEGRLAQEGACKLYSPTYQQQVDIRDTLELRADALIIREEVFNSKGEKLSGNHGSHSRKLSWYSGWAGLKRKRIDPQAADDDWVFAQGLRIHNEGQRIALREKDGTATGYEIQLARLTYQNTRVPILVLKFFREGEDSAFTYSWAESDSSRIGINLRWMQAGFTAE